MYIYNILCMYTPKPTYLNIAKAPIFDDPRVASDRVRSSWIVSLGILHKRGWSEYGFEHDFGS